MSLAVISPAPDNSLLQGLISGTSGVIALAYYVVYAIAMWRIFSKAGYPGILALIPIVNLIFVIKIAGYSGWLVLLFLIPLVNVVFLIIVMVRLGRAFGHGGAFSFFLLVLFAPIGQFIIGLSGDRYRRPA